MALSEEQQVDTDLRAMSVELAINLLKKHVLDYNPKSGTDCIIENAEKIYKYLTQSK